MKIHVDYYGDVLNVGNTVEGFDYPTEDGQHQRGRILGFLDHMVDSAVVLWDNGLTTTVEPGNLNSPLAA